MNWYKNNQYLLGYKVVGYKDGKAFSLMNREQAINLVIGSIINTQQFFLGTSVEFVKSYYSGLTDENELLLTYQYQQKDIIKGDPSGSSGEIVVKSAKLIKIDNI